MWSKIEKEIKPLKAELITLTPYKNLNILEKQVEDYKDELDFLKGDYIQNKLLKKT